MLSKSRVLAALTLCYCLAAARARAGDTEPPVITINSPPAGASLASGQPYGIAWQAVDNGGIIVGVDVYVSFDDGANWTPLAIGVEDLGGLTWYVHNRPTVVARVRVVAYDGYGNPGETITGAFTVTNGAVGRLPSTQRDFDAPGSQPINVLEPLNSPFDCAGCHGYYNQDHEPFFNWSGSMMAHASVDPLFHAAFEVAQYDAPESGEVCLRCHVANGWLQGRSNPADGSAIKTDDRVGVSCDLCHRMVNPNFVAGVSPAYDEGILAELAHVPEFGGNGQFVIDPINNRRRGPFTDALAIHEVIYSPFHLESALCGTCHDVSNPVFERQPDGTYLPGPFDQQTPTYDPTYVGAEQRTYSEWVYSAFNSPEGVFAPEFGGNREYVSSCQSCHMRAVTGRGCVFDEAPLRDDLPLHDFTGGNTWVLGLIPQVDPTVDPLAIQAGVGRARYMLQHAASLSVWREQDKIVARVTNKTGHKLPTGYPEGRRMWLNVRFFDGDDALLVESGAYDSAAAELTEDSQAKIYEAHHVIGEDVAPLVGLPAGTRFHLVLNNTFEKDNRIPPLGWDPDAYADFGGAPVGATYAAGQNWDDSLYTIPVGAVRAEVRLYYQTASKEYIEALADAGAPGGAAEQMHALWTANGKSPPELMVASTIAVPTQIPGDLNCDGAVDNADIDAFVLALIDPVAYGVVYPSCDMNQADVSGDGSVDNGDIDPFVALLLG